MTHATRAGSLMEQLGGVSNFSGYGNSSLTKASEAHNLSESAPVEEGRNKGSKDYQKWMAAVEATADALQAGDIDSARRHQEDAKKLARKVMGKDEALDAELTEATRYNVDGETLTKGQMLKKAVAKSVDFMSGKDTPTFHAIMKKTGKDQAEVFKITRREFDRLKVDDETTDRSKEKFIKFEISRLATDMSMSDKIDFNKWAKTQSREPSAEDKLAYLKQKFESAAAPVNEAKRAKKLKLSFGEISGINSKAKRGQLPTGTVSKDNYDEIVKVLKGRSKFGGITDEATAIKTNKVTFYGDKATKVADFLGPYLRVTVKSPNANKTTIEYYELPTDESLSERMVDSKKVDRTELATPVARTLDLLEKSGFKVKFDADTGEGELMYKGLKLGFESGGENLYLDLPRLFTKEAPEETVEALSELLDVVSNFGGMVR